MVSNDEFNEKKIEDLKQSVSRIVHHNYAIYHLYAVNHLYATRVYHKYVTKYFTQCHPYLEDKKVLLSGCVQ